MPKVWEFDKQERTLPEASIIKTACQKINWQNIILNSENNTVFLKEEGMKIGFGAIGKGYAANRAKKVMEKMNGIRGGLVNASGDLIAWGENGKPNDWQIQISDPNDKEKTLGWLNLNEMAIVTSGDYEKYFTNNGKRYAHIINPKTGYTSDYDLSALDSHKIGVGIKYNPLFGILRSKPFFKKRRVFSVKYLEMRVASYQRSTGLNAFIGSINIGFGFK